MADFGAPPDPSYRVPTIDMSRWTSGTAADRAALAAELDAAACTVGFLQLVNHSIPPSTLAAALAAADAFYALPAAEKALVVPPSKTVNRGYSAPRSEALALSLASAAAAPPPRPDTFEAFTFGEDAVDYALPFYAAGRERFFAPNIWPARPAGFRGAVVEYFEAARALGHTLTDVFAVALGLEAEYFRPLVDRSTTTMRVLNYDPAEDDAAQGGGMALEGGIDTGVQLRMGAHTDYGMLTVLYADRVHGLQIFDETGVWRSVLPEPGAILINFGDMMAEMTNDRWKSTLHRVVPAAKRRRSIAFFLDANYDATISCLPTCTDASNPPRYEPFNAGEHLMAKFLGPRTGTVSKALDTTLNRRRQDFIQC